MLTTALVPARAFSLDEQVLFAQLSGDHNPLHVDPLAARRTLFGRPVVHGIHLVLWALGECLPGSCRLCSLTVNFSSPVGIDELVTCQTTKAGDGTVELVLESRGAKCVSIKLTYLIGSIAQEYVTPNDSSVPTICRTLGRSDLAGLRGSLPLYLDRSRLDPLRGSIVNKVPEAQLAVLLASTRLVGMDCPGLHSIFAQLSLTFRNAGVPMDPVLRWQVESFDERFDRVVMSVSTNECQGTVSAFLRPQPSRQPSFDEVRRRVSPTQFAGQKALVLGGSRGIGEVCAKLLAAGGADVCLTYRQGAEEAQSIAQEIRAAGGSASALAFDVVSPPSLSTAYPNWFPTHVYYYPTPPIFVGTKGKFNHDIFALFYDSYVRGLSNTYQSLRATSKERVELLYPSSVALDVIQGNMGEYTAAKAAGEAFCRFLEVTDRNFIARIIRFPRLHTDQTSSVTQTDTGDTLEELIKILVKPPSTPVTQ